MNSRRKGNNANDAANVAPVESEGLEGNAQAQNAPAIGGQPKKESKSKRAVAAVKNANIATVFFVTKVVQIAMALTMLVFSVIRIAAVEDPETITGFMLSFYFLVFGFIFLFVELNMKKSRMWFFFLNSALGKGIFYCFLFLLCFGSGHAASWVDKLLATIFFVAACFFILLYCIFKSQEPAYINELVHNIKTGEAEAQKQKDP